MHTEPTGSNTLGHISAGLLTLSCSVLLPGTIINKDELDQMILRTQRPWVSLNFDGETTVAVICWDAEEDHSGILYFLPILRRPFKDTEFIHGLVLRKVSQNENTGRYSRLGCFYFDSNPKNELQRERYTHYYDTFLAIMEKHKQNTPPSDFSRILDRNEEFPGECGLIEII